MSMRCIPDALNFTGIQTTSHITSVCCKVLINILHFLSELFSDVVPCFAATEFWTGRLLPGFIKPSADHYICRNENGAASRSQLPSNHGAAKWHKTVQCCLQSYCMSRRMWCGRQTLPMCQCGVSCRWVATGASGKMPVCSYTKESETNGPPPPHLLFQLASFITLFFWIYTFLLSSQVQNVKIDTSSTQMLRSKVSKS